MSTAPTPPATPVTGVRALAVAALAGLAVLATRLPFLPTTFDDIDAVNFALALGDFDPSRHQPHPPGFPVYVLIARLAAGLAGVTPAGAARALGALSAVAQATLPLPLFVLFRGLGARPRIAAAAVALTLANPVVWMNGVRPMSDSVGLLLTVSTQALLLSAASGPSLVACSALCGLAIGARVQIAALALPLWARAMARAPRGRRLAVAAIVIAVLAWAIPTVLESGGPAAYGRALRGTAGDAVDVEPLALTWTLNRAARAARHVLFRPWGPEGLGVAMAALGLLGAVDAWRRGVTMRLAALAFAPYVAAHALFQQAHTQRYAMPYVPLLALLAALGLDAIARGVGRARAATVFAGLVAATTAAAAGLALPGLSAYAAQESPVYAALRAAGRIEAPPAGVVLSGHYMFSRFLAAVPPGMVVLPLPPRREMPTLEDAWRMGERRPILFLAEPRRTDLEAIDPLARRVLGRWSWPDAAARLLSGERPGSVDLVEIAPPRWLAGPGWGLSLEMALFRGGRPLRTAWLRGGPAPGLVMFAGEPTDPAAREWEGELSSGGALVDRRSCGAPWLAAYALPASGADAYVPLDFQTMRGGVAAAAPFALRGLAYGAAGDAMLVMGDGWHYPETSDDGRPFRWATRAARSIINVPPSGGRLTVEGEVPRHLAGPATITIECGGQQSTVTAEGRFRIELDLPPGPPREAMLRSDRDFVPDAIQHNGDGRRLALRVDRFAIAAR